MTVALVIVSHSAKVAEGVVEMAAQMAGEVPIRAAGGTEDGGIGTDATLIASAIADAPLVEGALIAAIQSSTGSSLEEVDVAARGAANISKAKNQAG